jgi:hypothetical protein
VRPSRALWWLPESALAGNRRYAPALYADAVRGRFPALEPACCPRPPASSGARRVVLVRASSRRPRRRRG